jgi:protein-L-isoaspartate(D-aspartate) O-methyltransferase
MSVVDASAEVAAIRRFYAEEIAMLGGVESPAIIDAFATVPRERFLGPGPWDLCLSDAGQSFKYRKTPDDHPRHVYHNVPVAIDQARVLNNGQPSLLAAWMEWLEIPAGASVIHIGSGTGYFSAILSAVVGPSGRVTAIEVDPSLAAQARANLTDYPNVTVVEGDGSALSDQADAILVNAGATHAMPAWLDALADGGRMLLPLTFGPLPHAPGKGAVIKITRHGDRFAATFGPMVAIYPCSGARDPEMNMALQKGFMQWMQGGMKESGVHSVRRDSHVADETCWAHRDGFCLSRARWGR